MLHPIVRHAPFSHCDVKRRVSERLESCVCVRERKRLERERERDWREILAGPYRTVMWPLAPHASPRHPDPTRLTSASAGGTGPQPIRFDPDRGQAVAAVRLELVVVLTPPHLAPGPAPDLAQALFSQ